MYEVKIINPIHCMIDIVKFRFYMAALVYFYFAVWFYGEEQVLIEKVES